LRFNCFIPEERTWSCKIGGWVGSKGDWTFWKEKNLFPSPGIEYMIPTVHLVTQPLCWIIPPPQLLLFGTESSIFSRSLISDRTAAQLD